MPIDPCQCPSTIEGLLKAIYCTLVDISENGAVVNLENITGISAFWKATLGGTPAADQVFGTDGAGVFTTFDLTDAGIELIGLNGSSTQSAIILNSDNVTISLLAPSDFADFMTSGAGGVTDPTSAAPFAVVNGLVTSVS